jgi:probable F420-dependent oxidoreductase
LIHGFTTERYLREVTMPTLERGLATSGRTRADVQVAYPGFVVTGTNEEELAAAALAVRRQIAFYGSTPAYRGVLNLHGWGDLQPELNRLSKQGEWAKMGELIDDEMLRTFAVVGPVSAIGSLLQGRFGDVVDRLNFYVPYSLSSEDMATIVAGVKSFTAG